MTRKLRILCAFLLATGWLFAVPADSSGAVSEISATVSEGKMLILSAPDGYKIDRVVFASYGTPVNYTIGNCHSVNSIPIVEAAIKNQSLSISASNSIFGDPCGGTYKSLSVILAIQEIPSAIEILTIGAPSNLSVIDGETATILSWDAPNTGTRQPERYAISFTTEGQNGWGIATGNVGDSNALNTTITIDHSLLESLMPSGTTWSFHIRSDNDTLRLYSENSNIVTLKIGKTAEELSAEQAFILAEQERLAAIAAAEKARLEAEAAAKIAEELAAKAEADRLAAIEAAKIQAEKDRLAAEAAALAEKERLASEAAAKKAEEERLAAEAAAKKAEQDRIAAELAAAKAEEEARLAEEARLKAEAEAKAAEEARLKAEEDARIAEEARLKAEEEARIAEEEAAKAEADRIAAEIAAAKAEEERLAAEAKAKAEEEARLESERIAAEEAAALAEEEARLKAEYDAKLEADRIKAEEAKEKAEEDARIAEEKALQAEKDKAIADAQKAAASGKELNKEEKAEVAAILIEKALESGQSITASQIESSGIEYKDLPPQTPVEVRTSESGEALVITAEVAANIELVTDAGALLEAAFTDPGAALEALGSIGADMTQGEREEATDMVVATVVAAGAAINAVGAASGSTGGSSSGGSSGGGSGGGGASGNSKGVRRKP